MYKPKPRSSISKPLLNPTPTSKRSPKTPLPSIHKENLLFDTNSIFRHQQATRKHPSKASPNSQKYCEMPQLLELKLTQPVKSPHQSKRKIIRPWAARPIDLNKQTIKSNIFRISLQKTKQLTHQRRPSMRESMLHSNELQSYQSEIKPNDECTKTVKFSKTNSTRERSQTTSRDKTASCKIALKKSIFPLSQRQYEQQRITEHFQRQEDLLSTIQRQQEADRFISVQSYSKLVF